MIDYGEDYLHDQKVKYIVFDYVDGRSLYDIITVGHLSVAQAKEVFLNLFKTVCSVHNKGIVHRDIKLDNFLITREGTIVLIDFGFASPLQGYHHDGFFHGDLIGTENYMAPEILFRQNYQGAPIDIFALGVLLF